MSWIDPKLDWKETDYYNADDLNRVENNTLEVINFLKSIQFNAPDVVSVTDRDIFSIEFLSSINRVEGNIEAIKQAFMVPPGWQNTKTWTIGKGFDYRDANRLENNLNLLYIFAQLAKENIVFCGSFTCGEEVLINAMV
jgi:hypothetical protein